jgi:hypothetical protein
MQELTRAAAYWSNEVDRQLRVIESLASKRQEMLNEAERLGRELSKERSVLEGLERIQENERQSTCT